MASADQDLKSQATSYLERFPSWAPKGERFLYLAGGPGQSDAIWARESDSSTVRLVQNLAFAVYSFGYRISTDRRRIAYADPSGIQILSSEVGARCPLSTPQTSAARCAGQRMGFFPHQQFSKILHGWRVTVYGRRVMGTAHV